MFEATEADTHIGLVSTAEAAEVHTDVQIYQSHLPGAGK